MASTYALPCLAFAMAAMLGLHGCGDDDHFLDPPKNVSLTTTTANIGASRTTTTAFTDVFCYAADNTQTGSAYFSGDCGVDGWEVEGKCLFPEQTSAEQFCSRQTDCVGIELVRQKGTTGLSLYPMKVALKSWTPPACIGAEACYGFLVKNDCINIPTTTTTTAEPLCFAHAYVLNNSTTGSGYFSSECGDDGAENDQGRCVFTNLPSARAFCNKETQCVGLEIVSQFGAPGDLGFPMLPPLKPWSKPNCTKGAQCFAFQQKDACTSF